ncbi:MAG: mandelate racemase/muconate lactonizing enzyme family protein [bacterium]|nr:mandelate racemase/muconate lactonizing enzyme family protein [bacterium]
MHIQRITATSVFIPYAPPVGPYIGRKGGEGTLGATALIVKVETDSGLVGWGEGIGQFETDPTPVLSGHHAADIETAITRMEKAGIARGPMSGIEMALWDLIGKHANLPLCRLLGGVVRTKIDFTACMGLKEPSQSAETARAYIDRWGFRFLKTKAGIDPQQDLNIAAAVQKEIAPEIVFRPDANGGYPKEDTLNIMKKMTDLGVRFFEDPCHTSNVETLAQIRNETQMGILINGGAGSLENVRTFLSGNAADMLMPDTPSCGALLRVRQVTDAAAPWNVPCLMHCSHDLGLKTAAVTHMAASNPNFSGPNDTCYHGLTDDILSDPFKFENGQLTVPMAPGLGVDVVESKLEKYRI